jgi:hypothetical protein
MKFFMAVQKGCGYKDTLRAHRYFAPLAKYFTVCITYQPALVQQRRSSIKWENQNQMFDGWKNLDYRDSRPVRDRSNTVILEMSNKEDVTDIAAHVSLISLVCLRCDSTVIVGVNSRLPMFTVIARPLLVGQ